MKRILFVSSLAAQLAKDQQMTPEALNKINEMLDLAKDAESMELGVELSNVIWKDAECSLMCFQVSTEQVIAKSEFRTSSPLSSKPQHRGCVTVKKMTGRWKKISVL